MARDDDSTEMPPSHDYYEFRDRPSPVQLPEEFWADRFDVPIAEVSNPTTLDARPKVLTGPASDRTARDARDDLENRFRWAFDGGERFAACRVHDGFHAELLARSFGAAADIREFATGAFAVEGRQVELSIYTTSPDVPHQPLHAHITSLRTSAHTSPIRRPATAATCAASSGQPAN